MEIEKKSKNLFHEKSYSTVISNNRVMTCKKPQSKKIIMNSSSKPKI